MSVANVRENIPEEKTGFAAGPLGHCVPDVFAVIFQYDRIFVLILCERFCAQLPSQSQILQKELLPVAVDTLSSSHQN